MDVTNLNFTELLPEITETIRECDFIAIDTELSGLLRNRSKNRFDLPEERFAKDVESSRGYLILQFGLSCFTRCSELYYTDRTYNFYIFPQKNNWEPGDIDRTFALQAHAIQFLIENGFDFNKLFKYGLSYLSFKEKKIITERLKQDLKKAKDNKDPRKEQTRVLSLEEQKSAMLVAKGFLEVLETMIIHKKPIVGHNLALDLIQIHNQFIDTLSNDYDAFKESCHTLFPLVYDTKFIAHTILEADSLTDNRSRLNDLYCQLRDSDTLPNIKVDHLNEFCDENQLPHQAAYDAYMSGYCFLVLCESYVREKGKYKLKGESGPRPVSIAQEEQIVTDLSNKIYLSYSHDFKYFNLSGYEDEPDRSHVFYMEFPGSWGRDDIFNVYRSFGGVTYCRLSKTSALCALRDPKYAANVVKTIRKLKDSGSNYKIYKYETYLESFKPRVKVEASGDNGDNDLSD